MRSQSQARVRRHATYANVMSTLAVVLVLAGGGAAVAATVQKNSVNSGSVKDNALKSKDLKDGQAVGSGDVIDNALTGADVNESTLSLPVPSAVGPNTVGSGNVVDNSLTKADLAAGSVGASEIGVLTKVETTVSVAAATTGSAIPACPGGSIAISGGGRSLAGGLNILGTSKENASEAWVYTVNNPTGAAASITGFVYCLAG